MPKLGLTMTEGLLAEWLVKVGDSFKAGDSLFAIETEKAAMDIEASCAGMLVDIKVQVGETVPVSAVVGYFDDGLPAGADTAPVLPHGGENQLLPLVSDATPAICNDKSSSGLSSTGKKPAVRQLVTPLARRMAKAMKLDLARITGTGPRGRIKASDLKSAATRDESGAVPVAQALGELGIRSRTKPDAIRATAARRLTQVKQEVPHFYLTSEAEVSRLLELHSELNAQDRNLRLTLTHFLVAAVGYALHDHPEANRVWSDGDIVEFSRADVGIAVNTESGLFVPVVGDVGRHPLLEVARRSQIQVEKARAGTMTINDMVGGAITVSNAGMFNVTYLTPIINPGQAMILGVGKVREILAPQNDNASAVRKEMGLVLAVDHRIHDGVAGIKFLNAVIDYLEQPLKLLLRG